MRSGAGATRAYERLPCGDHDLHRYEIIGTGDVYAGAEAVAECGGRSQSVSRIEAFFRFLWDFVVGDAWRTAAGVAVALGITALVAGAGIAAWWIPPVAVIVLLGASAWRVARSQ